MTPISPLVPRLLIKSGRSSLAGRLNFHLPREVIVAGDVVWGLLDEILKLTGPVGGSISDAFNCKSQS